MSLATQSGKILAIAVALAGLHAVVPMMAGQPTPALGSSGWEVLVLFIFGAALAVPVQRSSSRGWRLIGNVFLPARIIHDRASRTSEAPVRSGRTQD